MSSIFTKIVEGKIPCYKIDESEDCLAFLDINPNAYGHTLCILKREVDYIFSGYLSKGKYTMNWLVGSHPSGVYFINMISDINSITKKVSLIK